MTPKQTDTLIRYKEIKQLVKELETEADSMKEYMLSFLPEDADVETAEGKFTVQRRRIWTYTPGTVELEQMVKDKKKEEERTGDAKAKDGEPFIKYTTKKE